MTKLTMQEVVENFRKELLEAYEGILPVETLEEGNPWFENFIRSYIQRAFEAVMVGKKDVPGCGCDTYGGCGCKIDDYNLALADIKANMEKFFTSIGEKYE